MNEHLRKMLKDSAAALNVTLDERALDIFGRYYRELLIWNEKMNLTSVRTPEEMLIKHFIDSLTPLPYIVRPHGRLLDIGSGGGFPGIPLKIAMPALQVFLLETSRKKSSFLRHLIRHLPLAQTAVIHARAESAMTDDAYRHTFDTVISRAAFKLPEFIKIGRFFLSPGGLLIAMKGPSGEGEKEIINDLDVRCIACHDILLPFDGGRRIIMLFQVDRQ
ncbi:MAG: 16S rRNA (guanine(527)-N(7))-methyltransferase RsmG [Syntrophus sp. (in: bacteria)]|nr:16S rRNA (guanine(527)-N(7))-methyltransferase RsmG [Syntrophus sp. (in: bacteria)]